MALLPFIDVAIATTSIGVQNNSTRGSSSFLSSTTSRSVSISQDVIADPPANSVVLSQASVVVQRASVSRALGRVFRGASTAISVTDEYYDDLLVSVFANSQRPALYSTTASVVADKSKRLYWS